MPQATLVVYCLFSDVFVVAVLLSGLRLALARSDLTAVARSRIAWVIPTTLIAWNVLSFQMAARGVFIARRTAFHVPHTHLAKVLAIVFAAFPPILFAALLPVVVGLWLIFRSQAMAKVADATPLPWLVGVQFYRVIGALFLVMWGLGQLPWQFALPAGAGDVLVGVLAIPVAWAAAKGSKASRTVAYWWNVLGIADFVVAMTTGFLTSPTRFQLLAINHPNLLVSRFPLVMIPAFMVPLSSIMHGICLWKLHRLARTNT